jgi:hypothetical protein
MIHFSLSAQRDAMNQNVETYFFSFEAEIGYLLNFNISNITHSKNYYFKGFKQRVTVNGDKIEITFVYPDDAWHNDAFHIK